MTRGRSNLNLFIWINLKSFNYLTYFDDGLNLSDHILMNPSDFFVDKMVLVFKIELNYDAKHSSKKTKNIRSDSSQV